MSNIEHIPNVNDSTPGLDRPTQIGLAVYFDENQLTRLVPIYEPSLATNNQRIQADDVLDGWVFVSEELFTPSEPTEIERLHQVVEQLATGLAMVDGTTTAGLRTDIQQAAIPAVIELDG